jgi:hypothetical protein
VSGNLEVADGAVVATVVVHRDEVQQPRSPELVGLAANHAALQDRPRSREFTDAEGLHGGQLPELDEIVVADPNEREYGFELPLAAPTCRSRRVTSGADLACCVWFMISR